MKRILVFQHVPYEPLGTLNPQLKAAGFRIRYVNFSRTPEAVPSVDGYNGLVVLGGPMGAYQTDRHPHLGTEIELIRQALHLRLPVLGICLGAQLLARALGAKVGPASKPEIGWHTISLSGGAQDDPLFRHFKPTQKIFQWHSDTFALPRGATHLAASAVCNNQAFKFGDNAYGLQFHLEVDRQLIGRWLKVPAHQRELEAMGGAVDPEQVLLETRAQIAETEQLAEAVFGEFIKLFSHHGRRRVLGSR
jgi:GMP synthase (glutamine-hydrolysing)